MSLKFAYRGSEFPNEDMVFWLSHNIDSENMDDFVMEKFFERFTDELSDLSYMEMLDVFEMARNMAQ